MADKKIKAKTLTGLDIFQTGKQTILYDLVDRKPRVMDDDDAKKYILWSSKLPVSIIIGGVVFSKTNNLLYFALVGVACYIIGYIAYWFMFINKLPIAKKFDKSLKKPIYENYANDYSRFRLICMTLAALALAIVMVWYGYNQHYEGLNLYMCYLVGAVCLGLTYIGVRALLIQQQQKK